MIVNCNIISLPVLMCTEPTNLRILIAFLLLYWKTERIFSFVIHATEEFLSKPITTNYHVTSAPDGLELPSIYLCPHHPVHDHEFDDRRVNRTWKRANVDGLLKFKPGNNSG